MNTAVLVLTFVAALGCGVAAGVFFAFSSFVMKGLARIPAPAGIAAMKSINVTAVLPPLMIELMGTALVCVGLIVVAVLNWSAAYSIYLLGGGVLYLLTAIAPTIAYHVPRNDALAAMDPSTPEAARYWATYLRQWTAANHLRTVGPLVATALLIGALHVG